ncbi:MAG: hypothetical protein OEV44_15310 [Spirochaetota bacterium]|nr:hypothetical protein [Spirochaetota bacterium]
MYKVTIIILIITIIGMGNLAYTKDKAKPDTDFTETNFYETEPEKKSNTQFKLNMFGYLGNTSVTKGLTQSKETNYGFGSQVLFIKNLGRAEWNIGAELGFSRFYNIYSTNLDTRISYVQTLFINEISVDGNLFRHSFQLGFGPLWGIEKGSGIKLDVMLSGGFEIIVNKKFTIPIRLRTDLIYFSDRVIAGVSMLLGISVYIGT